MPDDLITDFLQRSRTATLATWGASGSAHLVAMWYGLVEGDVCFETKVKSQKVVNLRRDPRVAVMVEAGDRYHEVRGVSIEGRAEIVDDPTDPTYWAAAESLFERYYGPPSRAAVERMMHKRVVVRIRTERVRSWDHRRTA